MGTITNVCGTCGRPTDDPSPELRMWAFERLAGWGRLRPETMGLPVPEFQPYNLDERMKRAEDLARWVLGENDDAAKVP